MPFSAALPSPPEGVPLPGSPQPGFLGSLLAKAIAPEESDLSARVAVGSALAAGLPRALTTILGYPDYLVNHPALLHLIMPLWPVIPALAMTGLLSRSPTARFLGAATTTFLALLAFLTPRIGMGEWVFDILGVGFQVATTGAVVLWLLRAARRRLLREGVGLNA